MELMRSRISGCPGSARMLRCPRARGPNSIRPRYHARRDLPGSGRPPARTLVKSHRTAPPRSVVHPGDRCFDCVVTNGGAEKRNREIVDYQDPHDGARPGIERLPAQSRRRPRQAERRLIKESRTESACRWPCNSARRRRPSPAGASRSPGRNGRKCAELHARGRPGVPQRHRNATA